ncbi:hypothetical protein [Microbispora corallina]
MAWQDFYQALINAILVNLNHSGHEDATRNMLDYLADVVRYRRQPVSGFVKDVMLLPGADRNLLQNLWRRASAEPIAGSPSVASALEEVVAARPAGTAESSPTKPALRRRRVQIPRQVEDVDGYGLKPDPLTAQTPGELVDRMRRYRIWAGDLALRELVRRANGAFALSTLSKTLREDKLPPLELLLSFIRACGGSDDDVQRWGTAWRQIRMPQPCAELARPLSPVTRLPRARTAG